MRSCHSLSTEEQRHNSIGRLQAGANEGDVARHMGVCRATTNRLWGCYNLRITRDRLMSYRPRMNLLASFLMNLASCCSEQMDVPESIDVLGHDRYGVGNDSP